MNSKTIKAVVLAYYRYKRGYFVSTETDVTSGIADVLAVNKDGTISVEIEVKTSYADLQNEWKNKKRKHSKLQESSNRQGKANYYYFAIPEKLYTDKLVKNIEEMGSDKYGIIVINSSYQVEIRKQAKRLNKSKNDYIKHAIFLRATSELTNDYVQRHTPLKRLY